ncbi:hypothetical protein CYMTET_19250 [Cymbomonas tetramitiformis]|uniref:Uncharacterized protein n=1 Tax=Cymbomonas tetramitiformis TaxID=36881 RepID=A0AAE0G7R1_9CHLO|nr:hypothetical protein CYMTET_19250 [Cymbomonas tetramitiformis]
MWCADKSCETIVRLMQGRPISDPLPGVEGCFKAKSTAGFKGMPGEGGAIAGLGGLGESQGAEGRHHCEARFVRDAPGTTAAPETASHSDQEGRLDVIVKELKSSGGGQAVANTSQGDPEAPAPPPHPPPDRRTLCQRGVNAARETQAKREGPQRPEPPKAHRKTRLSSTLTKDKLHEHAAVTSAGAPSAKRLRGRRLSEVKEVPTRFMRPIMLKAPPINDLASQVRNLLSSDVMDLLRPKTPAVIDLLRPKTPAAPSLPELANPSKHPSVRTSTSSSVASEATDFGTLKQASNIMAPAARQPADPNRWQKAVRGGNWRGGGSGMISVKPEKRRTLSSVKPEKPRTLPRPTSSKPDFSSPSPTPENSQKLTNPRSADARLDLARVLCEFPGGLKSDAIRDEVKCLYRELRELEPRNVDASIGLGEVLAGNDELVEAIREMAAYPDAVGLPSFDDSFVHIEIIRLIMKLGGKDRNSPYFSSAQLKKSLVIAGKVMGFDGISKYVNTLDQFGRWDLLMEVYSAINDRPQNDKSMLDFFKAMGWMQ